MKLSLVIFDIFQTACQDDDDDDDGSDDQEAEYDAFLVESAGEILPAVAKMVGGEAFMAYFKLFVPDLIKRAVSFLFLLLITFLLLNILKF